jgi:catechol 2,3-dioxygenase-like lactoylglutathione lyase family enzyme
VRALARVDAHFETGGQMLDHAGFGVSDFQRSKAFYEKALAPLGVSLLMEPMGRAAGFGRDRKPFFWIQERPPAVQGGLHIAFAVSTSARE